MNAALPQSQSRAVAFPLSTAISQTCLLPTTELNKLYRAADFAIQGTHSVMQFISSYANEGADLIAFETALVAATLSGKKVLFIDAADVGTAVSATPNEPAIDGLLAMFNTPHHKIRIPDGTNLLYTVLRRYGNNGDGFTSINEVKFLIERLRPAYDLIIIHSPAILNDAFGLGLSEIVDGSILVVEAERTRAPVTLEAKRLIAENGGRVIGAVLNKRKLYIPQKLYRWLYRHDTAA